MIFRYQRRKIIIGNHWQSLALFDNHWQSLAIFRQSLAIKPIWAIKNSAFPPLLHSFIEEYHADDEYIFWPDLASSHYANETTKWLIQHKVKFVPKQVNPPNIPKATLVKHLVSKILAKI